MRNLAALDVPMSQDLLLSLLSGFQRVTPCRMGLLGALQAQFMGMRIQHLIAGLIVMLKAMN
jgi:hypothetical protein